LRDAAWRARSATVALRHWRSFDEPAGVAVDRAGGVVVGEASHRVRYLACGSITTIAGSGASGFLGDGGRAIDAQLNDPNGMAIDAAGGVLIADTGNDRIRRLDRDGTITTIAGGGFRSPRDDDVLAFEATLQSPLGVAVDHVGNIPARRANVSDDPRKKPALND
jgi:DNA-binding beta-propeller fold protein YncE